MERVCFPKRGNKHRDSLCSYEVSTRFLNILNVQSVHKVRNYFVENGIFLIYIVLYRCMLFIVKLCIKNFI